MIELSDEKVIYAFAQDLEPALTVESGDTVRVRTKDCFGNQLQGPEDKLDYIDWDRINPATGPIYVNGAVKGGTLKVKIESIDFDEQAACCTGKDEGICGDILQGWSTAFCKVTKDEVVWNDKLSLPLRPMIGVIGVAPEGEPVNCGTPGSHGGNMDNTAITAGATLYFPVACDGALFGCGDMHACMGDGEIGVSGAEIAGYATVTLTALPELKIANPILENETHLVCIASAETLDEACDIVVHDMLELLHSRTGAPKDELTMLLSLAADLHICQVVDPEKTVRYEVPKYVLSAYGFEL